MMGNENYVVNAEGHLTVGGADCLELIKQFGSPLYVLDENAIRRNCAEFRDSIEEFYDGNGLCVYASKAFCCKEMCRIVAQENCGLDVVSGGEIYTAWKSDFPMDRVVFHGNNKTDDEIRLALRTGVGRIVVDNVYELRRLEEICRETDKQAKIYLRIKPGIDAHTHDFIRTGQIDSKFGFALETCEAIDAVEQTLRCEHLTLAGVHCHIGSQIFELDPFALAAEVMVRFIAQIRDRFSLTVGELDLGGGFGIRYTESDQPLPYREFMRPVSAAVKSTCHELHLPVPKILIEPGRSIVAPAGVTLYTVGAVKNIPGVRTYVSVDGGMGDNPRYILYGAKYETVVANRANQEKTATVTLAGKYCESGDLICENAPIQPVEVGDVVAVLATGAYNYSMASNYNRIPRLPVVMVRDGVPRVIVRRETYDDIIALDV